MTDLWSFLLQTLTASGAAVLLLVVKAMFRDKLSPRWQFASWSVLGLILLVPAGLGGRHALVDWGFLIEACKSAVTGEFGTLTQVLAPIPLPAWTAPASAADWLYLIYIVGAAGFLLRYVFAYVRLRWALQQAVPEEDPRVRDVAEKYQLPVCPAVRVAGLPSAFICGVFHPVLALPAGEDVDEKVLLHELTHLAHHDAAWGLLICFFRCLHWCNPLLWACANLAQNDLEACCDQRVLEQLEGEDRREYGRILLDMADDRYARVPGTSSMANGVNNIRRRIQAIARFKKYPRGMTLVSVCVLVALAVPLLVGIRAEAETLPRTFPVNETVATMTKARTIRCTTCDGALDTYAKAVLFGKASYRAMCAPLSEQNTLAAEYQDCGDFNAVNWTSLRLPGHPSIFSDYNFSGYTVYNLIPDGEDAYTCLMAITLLDPAALEDDSRGLQAVQPLRAEKQDGRWVVLPQGEFQAIQTKAKNIPGIEPSLPCWTYEAQAGDFLLQVKLQNVAYSSADTDDTAPHPNMTFTKMSSEEVTAFYTGTEADKDKYSELSVSYLSLNEGQKCPELPVPDLRKSITERNVIPYHWNGRPLAGDWPDTFCLNSYDCFWEGDYTLPDYYAADLYLNQTLTERLTLLPVEGGSHD